ncbi:MAG: farnesyl diphosphate synthase [Opitutaceae bacterium]
MDFTTKLRALVSQVEQGLERYVPPADTRPVLLHQAMRYSLESGGKRIRPVIVLAVAELFDPSMGRDPLPAAVALECLHTYSLIHDDLPCMDDDDLRRGRPTVHKAFDEATALLAGDALLTHALGLMVSAYAEDPALAVALTRDLADAAGSRRLIGGQVEDLAAEGRTDVPAADLEFIHLNKTAALLEASFSLGARIGGASDHDRSLLVGVGRDLGLAFQIVDDVLDATAESATLGKTAGKDAKSGKTTYVSVFGVEGARLRARAHSDAARDALRTLPGDITFLTELVEALTVRKK